MKHLLRVRRSLVWVNVIALLVVCALGCIERPIGLGGPETTSVILDQVSQQQIDKIDLLIMVDNSSSMGDKQRVLRAAVPDLVQLLVDPPCINAEGERMKASDGQCPPNFEREYHAVSDIHVGVISSSINDFGAPDSGCPSAQEGMADGARLLGSLPRGKAALGNSTLGNAFGFLDWKGSDPEEFQSTFSALVGAVGEKGCGYESSLESWYRFLVDPEPYAELEQVACADGRSGTCVQPKGLDSQILEQRAAFLRPDSLLAVVMLSDENDCSLQIGARKWRVVSPERSMFRAATLCDSDPNAACCYSCGQSPPAGCEPDPICGDPQRSDTGDLLSRDLDHPNLRCFEQKRRFGVDLLYPLERYTNALLAKELCLDRADLDAARCQASGRLVANPLYHSTSGVAARDPSLVFFAGIVGAPWQDLARDPRPDAPLEFKNFDEMTRDGTWQLLLSDDASVQDPLMRESVLPRTGVQPVLGENLAPPEADTALANTINGHEWDAIEDGDLQYACVFPLPEPRDCSLAGVDEHCDCAEADGLQRPLCQSPADGSYSEVQHFAKAYPGLRQLEVLRQVGEQTGNAIAASICARNLRDATLADYAYRPAVRAIVERLKVGLMDRCVPRKLHADPETGEVACRMIEAVASPERCSCEHAARREVEPELTALVHERMAKSALCSGADCNKFCLCEIEPTRAVSMAAETDCETHAVVGEGSDGWCYVDSELGGNPELVKDCPATARHTLRFVGEGKAQAGAHVFISCIGAARGE